jgi:hypothetical protein
VIDRRGGEALAVGGKEPRLHISGRGGRQILIEARLPWGGESHAKAFERVQGALDCCRGILPRLQVCEVGGYKTVTLRA